MVKLKDLQLPNALFYIDKKGRSILHLIAQSKLPHKLDLLFYYICLGSPQYIIDQHNQKFTHYLKSWEIKHLQLLFNAWKLNKIRINEYADTFTGYIPHGYSPTGIPVLFTIWEHDLGEELLQKALEGGYNLDHPMITKSNPPIAYKKILAKRGCVFENLDGVEEESNIFYPTSIWSFANKIKTFCVHPVKGCIKQLFHRSIVCIADTHWEHCKLNLPHGDILVCAGDLQMPWTRDPTEFILWMGSQPHPWKILIAGNHDKLILANKTKYLALCKANGIVYLEDSGVNIDGIKFWGTPWTPIRPRNKNNAFTLNREELMQRWNKIPSETDVLITHCPPYGIGDLNSEYYKGVPFKGGDFGLTKTINRLHNLKLHIFGHQHYGRGVYKNDDGVYFTNCAVALDPTAFCF